MNKKTTSTPKEVNYVPLKEVKIGGSVPEVKPENRDFTFKNPPPPPPKKNK
ncbi:hypothetical protein [Bacteroides heparinolyticus]|uniref:hypothetical protein n=1 Tax=Prevotella heparinolytica TaxID=28113 RepID=UPI0023F2653C|nr:hypothetical protein [Bacteroides heparinolyticus]